MKKQCGFLLLYVVVAVLLLPLLLTILCGGLGQELPQEAQVLYGLADLAPLDTELEEYVAGVVAGGNACRLSGGGTQGAGGCGKNLSGAADAGGRKQGCAL